MFFSVIIPLYNKAEYISRCLDSVLKQEYDQFEILVVDDGSEDGSSEIVRSYKDSRIHLIKQGNSGVSVARNTGVAAARYNYVTFLDADDTWEQSYLTELKKLIRQFPGCGIYGLNHYHCYENGHIASMQYTNLFKGEESGIIPDFFSLFAELEQCPFSNSNCCYPKEVFLEIGGYTPGVKLTEDSELWCRIALNYSVAFCIKPLATYFVETPQNTRGIIEEKDFQVTKTLKACLKNGLVHPHFERSVKKLIAFQELSLVRRAILNGYKSFALKKLFKRQLIIQYPFYFILYLILIMMPVRIVIRAKNWLSGRS